eukprot:262856-Prorocentrum_minimum.AAC.1
MRTSTISRFTFSARSSVFRFRRACGEGNSPSNEGNSPSKEGSSHRPTEEGVRVRGWIRPIGEKRKEPSHLRGFRVFRGSVVERSTSSEDE